MTIRFTAADYRREAAEGFDAFGPDFMPTADKLEQAAEQAEREERAMVYAPAQSGPSAQLDSSDMAIAYLSLDLREARKKIARQAEQIAQILAQRDALVTSIHQALATGDATRLGTIRPLLADAVNEVTRAILDAADREAKG